MATHIAEYVQNRDGELYVGATRVSLQSIIGDWKRGRTPEQVATDFPSVSLVEIYGAITYYLERRQDLDSYFHEVDGMAARDRAAHQAAHAAFYDDMRARIATVRPRVRNELQRQGILDRTPGEPGDVD
jgi:uncharacterized protein (DUF433 family)